MTFYDESGANDMQAERSLISGLASSSWPLQRLSDLEAIVAADDISRSNVAACVLLFFFAHDYISTMAIRSSFCTPSSTVRMSDPKVGVDHLKPGSNPDL